MNILFHSSRSFFHFTDIYEYAIILLEHFGYYITYIGFNPERLDSMSGRVRIIHLEQDSMDDSTALKNYFRKFLKVFPQDGVHVFTYRGGFILPADYQFKNPGLDIGCLILLKNKSDFQKISIIGKKNNVRALWIYFQFRLPRLYVIYIIYDTN